MIKKLNFNIYNYIFNYIMGKNTSENSRKGAVKERSQVYNPIIDGWIKRDKNTGQFMKVKKSSPFKGVKKEKDKEKTIS